MSNVYSSHVYNKHVSSRIYRLLVDQNYQCRSCSSPINASTVFETENGLICGSCNLKALKLA
jgi:hypothetical protein